MLMYIFNTEVFQYIKIIASTLVGLLTFGGAFRAFTCDTFFYDYKIQEGRKRLIQGSTLFLIGFLICYGWTVLRSNGYFKHFDEETFGTPAYIIENREREKEKELSKLKRKSNEFRHIHIDKNDLKKVMDFIKIQRKIRIKKTVGTDNDDGYLFIGHTTGKHLNVTSLINDFGRLKKLVNIN